MKAAIASLLFLLSTLSFAGDYYRELDTTLKGKTLRDNLHKLISDGHKSLDYKTARKHLFGELHLESNGRGVFIEDVYCKKTFTRSNGVGRGKIPNSNVINCEHTWPQSKFSGSYSKSLQKGDLHHLYPTDNRANSTRGNHPFGNVHGTPLPNNCETSSIGGPASLNKRSSTYFEPPHNHKGNVARAIFYFAVRYKMDISAKQEQFLREWHRQDPVDHDERERNDRIYEIQGNKNPFIDNPRLVSKIQNF